MSMLLRRRYSQDDGVVDKATPSPVKEEKIPTQEIEVEAEITASEIQKMTGPKIRKFAKENGVDNPEEFTVAELKAILCEKFS